MDNIFDLYNNVLCARLLRVATRVTGNEYILPKIEIDLLPKAYTYYF